MEARANALEFFSKLMKLNPKKIMQHEVGSALFERLLLNFLARSVPLTFKNDVILLLFFYHFSFSSSFALSSLPSLSGTRSSRAVPSLCDGQGESGEGDSEGPRYHLL